MVVARQAVPERALCARDQSDPVVAALARQPRRPRKRRVVRVVNLFVLVARETFAVFGRRGVPARRAGLDLAPLSSVWRGHRADHFDMARGGQHILFKGTGAGQPLHDVH